MNLVTMLSKVHGLQDRIARAIGGGNSAEPGSMVSQVSTWSLNYAIRTET